MAFSRPIAFAFALTTLGTVTLTAAQDEIPEAARSTEKVDFVHDIVPILKQHCVTCHAGRESEGDLSINTRASLVEAGAIDLDNPPASRLLELITSTDVDEQMPPQDRPRVSPAEIAVLRRWIEQELPWDDDYSFALNTYEPPLSPRRPELPPVYDDRDHPIDRILDQYLRERELTRPERVDDATFARRISLDLVGLLPDRQRLAEFSMDPLDDKRERLIDELLADNIAYADHWLSFFNDLLRNDYSGTGFITGGRRQVTGWLYRSLVANKRFDQLARELIAPPSDESRGYIDGIKWRGEVSAGQTLEIQFAQSISQSFLGINLKCASCHDSFIDRWTLKEAYGLGAIYASSPLSLHRCDKPTGEVAQAAWLFPELGQVDPTAPRDERLRQLAELMTHPDNGRFTRTIVNRLWHRMMGRGLVHPLDAMQTEPWNEDLLDYLAVHLADNDYDLKATLRLIATSEAYQSRTEPWADGATAGDYVYHGPRARRMTAEQFLDAVWKLTGAAPGTFDAPIERTPPAETPDLVGELRARWIWGDSEGNAPPAGETLVIRKSFVLPVSVKSAGAIVTCDNSYVLYVNGFEVSRSEEWTKLQAVAFSGRLAKGENRIEIIAKNGGNGPNAAGLFFDARIILDNGDTVSLSSDDSWEWSRQIPEPRDGRIGAIQGPWHRAMIPEPVAAWATAIEPDGRARLASIATGRAAPMVRASLLKNTPLMQSLGRPLREQIVTMRPETMTTIEAIDLANDPGLAEVFAVGARNWLELEWPDTDHLVNELFNEAISRKPTSEELELFREALGELPTEEAMQDALWAICMLPEFLLNH